MMTNSVLDTKVFGVSDIDWGLLNVEFAVEYLTIVGWRRQAVLLIDEQVRELEARGLPGWGVSTFAQGAPVWGEGRGLCCALLHGGGDCRDFGGVSHGLGSCSPVSGFLLGGYLEGFLVEGGYDRWVRVGDGLGAVLRECLYRLKHVGDVGLLDSRGGALQDTCLWVLGEVCGEVDSGVLCRWRPAVWAPGL